MGENPVTTVPESKTAIVPKTLASVKIMQIDANNSPEGRMLIYTDRTSEGTDTIRIFIPVMPAVVKNEATERKDNPVAATPVNDAKFLDIELQNPNTTKTDTTAKVLMNAVPEEKAVVVTTVAAAGSKPTVNFNSDCKVNAREDDFLKLRKRMAAETTDDRMISVAKKFFAAQCWYTDQIRNLSVLFLSDSGKYVFFEAAYAHIYDTQNFQALQSQLNDEYYVKKFKALLHH